MSAFDLSDALLSAAVGRVFGDPVTWRPMRKRGGGSYTQVRWEPDPDRPVRALEGVVVTWRTTTIEGGTSIVEQGGVQNFDCLVDAETGLFVGEQAEPRVGDTFDVVHPLDGNTRVAIDRKGDDGSGRVFFWCNFPQG